MSSNITVLRICEHCQSEFVAKTTVTRFCGDDCAKKNYKLRLKNKKIQKSNEWTASKRIELSKRKDLSVLEYLNPTDASKLLQCSRMNIYDLMNTGQIKYSQLSEKKRLISRDEINRYLSERQPQQRKQLQPLVKPLDLANSLSMKEAQEYYGISEKALYDLIKRHNIKKYKSGRYVFAHKLDLDRILAQPYKTLD